MSKGKRVKHTVVRRDLYEFHNDRLDMYATWHPISWSIEFSRPIDRMDERQLVHLSSFLMFIRKQIKQLRSSHRPRHRIIGSKS